MKKTLLTTLLMFAAAAFIFAGGQSEQKEASENSSDNGNDKHLVIYAYDSFASEWGPAVQAIPPFEEKYGIKVDIKTAGDGGQVLSRAILEKDNPQADIIIGIDNNMLAKALNEDILDVYKPENIKFVPEELIFDDSYHVIPFDYGYFAINYDSAKVDNPPKSLEDLTKDEYKDSIVLMDPRTSNPGLGFLLWTISVYGDDFTDYWKRLKPSIMTITDGWSSGYGLYTSGEASYVLSYNTSPPVHIETQGTDRYKAAIFDEGNYLEIEGMGILKGAANKEAAKKFIEYMLTDDFQKAIPLTNYMMPISSNTELPKSFEGVKAPEKILQLNKDDIENNLDNWIKEWLEVTVD
ncbi:MAG: thiamine ABC transporter substrate binding subunit [Spirochaetales bacterium]|nr:thiamine ABC transporter substrate binding subunit [Spirochaetales bacterium]